MRRMLLKVRWPELNREILAGPTQLNRELFDWFLKNTPCKGLQGHAVVSGKDIYSMNVPMRISCPFKLSELETENLSTAPIGRIFYGLTIGKVGGASIKYGEISENMSYPVLGQVREEDIETLKEAGAMVWDAIYNTKKIITCEYEEVEEV